MTNWHQDCSNQQRWNRWYCRYNFIPPVNDIRMKNPSNQNGNRRGKIQMHVEELGNHYSVWVFYWWFLQPGWSIGGVNFKLGGLLIMTLGLPVLLHSREIISESIYIVRHWFHKYQPADYLFNMNDTDGKLIRILLTNTSAHPHLCDCTLINPINRISFLHDWSIVTQNTLWLRWPYIIISTKSI